MRLTLVVIRPTGRSTRKVSKIPKPFGQKLLESCIGLRSGTRCSTILMRPFLDGLMAAAQIFPTIVLDRHIDAGRGDKIAIHWEGEPGDSRDISYAQLHLEVCRLANALKSRGVQKGDRIAVYLPMIPELAIAVPRLCTHWRCSLGHFCGVFSRLNS
jgi:hypothetical protein